MMRKLLIILYCLLSLLSCGKVSPTAPWKYCEDYAFDFKKVEYSALFKNRERLFDSINYSPADSAGVALFAYEGRLYYHPVNISYRSLEALNDYYITGEERYLIHAKTSMEALRQRAVRHQNMLYFPYNFDFPYKDLIYHAPWFSGMAQGCALSAYSRLYYFDPNPLYKAVADSILNTMTDFESRCSGVKITTYDKLWGAGTYYWVDEYPAGPRRYVLNGSIIGAMGLYDHWWVFGDSHSLKLFSCELSSIKDKVHLYRNKGDISAYCLRYRQKYPNYHLVHTQLLDKCAELSQDKYFNYMADLFREDAQVK